MKFPAEGRRKLVNIRLDEPRFALNAVEEKGSGSIQNYGKVVGLGFFQEGFVDVCGNARGHASCQDEKLCIFEMRDDAVDHAIYRILAHRAAFVIEFAHRAVGFVEDFDVHAEFSWDFFQVVGNGDLIQGGFDVGTAFFVGETEAEGGGAEIFQGAADVQAFAADFSAGG